MKDEILRPDTLFWLLVAGVVAVVIYNQPTTAAPAPANYYVPKPGDPGFIGPLGPGDPGYIPGPGDPGFIGPIQPNGLPLMNFGEMSPIYDGGGGYIPPDVMFQA